MSQTGLHSDAQWSGSKDASKTTIIDLNKIEKKFKFNKNSEKFSFLKMEAAPTEVSGDQVASSDTSSSDGNATGQSSGRLRTVRRVLADGTQELEDDDFEAPEKPAFVLQEKLTDEKFTKENVVKELLGHELTIAHLQKEGFSNPILVREKESLGIKVPTLDVQEIRAHVGSRRYLEVMDVTSQKNIQMTMKEFNKYWTTPPESRTQLLNVISLEFSNTKLDPLVSSILTFPN